MQGIYTYIRETNYVPREYSVAGILLLLFIVRISLVSVLNLLNFYISTFRSVCSVPNIAVFCSSLTSCFSGMLLTYLLLLLSSSSSSPSCSLFIFIFLRNYVPREYSVTFVTIHGVYIASSSVESIEFLH